MISSRSPQPLQPTDDVMQMARTIHYQSPDRTREALALRQPTGHWLVSRFARGEKVKSDLIRMYFGDADREALAWVRGAA